MKDFFIKNQQPFIFAILVGITDYFVINFLLSMVSFILTPLYEWIQISPTFILYATLLVMSLVYVIALSVTCKYFLRISIDSIDQYFLWAWGAKVCIALLAFGVNYVYNFISFIVVLIQLIIAYFVGAFYKKYIKKHNSVLNT